MAAKKAATRRRKLPAAAATKPVAALPAVATTGEATMDQPVAERFSESQIGDALTRAGVNDLPSGPRSWLYDRMGRFGLADGPLNLGGMRPGAIGCGRDGRAIVGFASLDDAAEALVDTARRAGATPLDPAPDIALIGDVDEYGQWHAYWRLGPFLDSRGRQREGWHRHPQGTRAAESVGGLVVRDDETPPAPLDVGWIPFLGPSDQAEKVFQQLRSDWAGFEASGVGAGNLAFLKTDVDEWHKFRDAWEISEWTPTFSHPDLGEPSELGSRLNAEVMRSNRVRAELASAAQGHPVAPVDLPPELQRKGVDLTDSQPMLKFAERVDTWAQDVPVLSWMTNPKQKPADAGKRIIGVVAAVVALGGLAIWGTSRRAQVVVNVRGGRR